MKLSNLKISTQLVLMLASAIVLVCMLLFGFSAYELRSIAQTANSVLQSFEREADEMDTAMSGAFASVLQNTEEVVTALSDEHLYNLASGMGGRIQALIGAAMENARTLASAVNGYKAGTPVDELDRNMIIRLLQGIQNKHPELIAVWIAFEPNAFDGKDDDFKGRGDDLGCDETGRFLPWFFTNKEGKKGIEPLKEMETSEYYMTPKRTRQEFVTDPYDYFGFYILSAAVPVIVDGTLIGVAGVDLEVNLFDKILAGQNPYETGYFYLVNKNGFFLWHPDKSYVTEEKRLEDIPGGRILAEAVRNKTPLKAAANDVVSGEPIYRVLEPIQFGRCPDPWGVVLSAKQEKVYERLNEIKRILDDLGGTSSKHIESMKKTVLAADETARETLDKNSARAMWMMLCFVTGTLVVVLPGMFFYGRSFAKPILQSVGILQSLAEQGDISLEVPRGIETRGDEIGAIGRGIKHILIDYRQIAARVRNLADGDWTDFVQEKGAKDTLSIDFRNMYQKVNETLREINTSVARVTTGSAEVSIASQSLSSGAQEAAASLEEITASMNEISSQTRANAESAAQAHDLAQKASSAAANGQQAMQEMTAAMDRITKNSNEIQRVIKVIDDIAFQTNLLALNAAVEAARAGQHGKGFAVVAEEVRNLASRSAKAAQETSDLIAKSGHEIDKGGEIAAHTAKVLNAIVEQIKQTTDLVAGIAVASNEQAEGVNQVTIGLQQIDAVTQQNTASAEESASAAGEMSGMAANLQKLVGQFQLRA